MCGIVSLVSKGTNGFTQVQISIFNQLLYADQLRGIDATGVFYNTKKNKMGVKILKAAMRSSLFLHKKEYKEVNDTLWSDSNFIVGHNRAATKGNKDDTMCAHPFREKHIVLVHNGTLTTQKELDDTAEVDSHAICKSIAEKGEEETFKNINGAFALIWSDGIKRTLNFSRNYQRPLYIMDLDHSWLILSEPKLGEWIADRNNCKVKSVKELEPKKIYYFTIDNMSTLKEKPIELKSFYQGNSNGYDNKTPFNDSEWVKGRKHHHTSSSNPTNPSRPFNINTAYDASGLRKYTFGETIYMKGGIIRPNLNHPSVSYLDADIYNEHTEASEDEYRIKYVNTEEIMRKFALQPYLKGKVVQTLNHNGYYTYTVTDLEIMGEFPPKKGTNIIPFIKEPENNIATDVIECDICGIYFHPDKTASFMNKETCPTCLLNSQHYLN